MANPIQFCTNCEYVSPGNWRRCHNCSNVPSTSITSPGVTIATYEQLDQYYGSLSDGYDRHASISAVIAYLLILSAIPLYFLDQRLFALYYLISPLFLSYSLLVSPDTYEFTANNQWTFADYSEILAAGLILAIPIIYIPMLFGSIPIFVKQWRPQQKVSQIEAINSLLEIAADGQQEAAVTAFALLASMERSRIRSEDMYIFYRFVEEHPNVVFTQIRSDQLSAVVSNLYGDLSLGSPKRREIVELLAESSDGQYTQDEINSMIS